MVILHSYKTGDKTEVISEKPSFVNLIRKFQTVFVWQISRCSQVNEIVAHECGCHSSRSNIKTSLT